MQNPPLPAVGNLEVSAARPPMRIAFVTETYPPEVNGVATTTARFVEGLVALRHEVQLVRPRQPDADRAGARHGIEEVLVPGLPIPRYPHLRMGLPRRQALVRLWQHLRPDVVHVATEGPLGWSAVQAARQLGIALTSDFRTNFHAYSRHYGIGWLHRPIMGYLRSFHNRCACTLVPTELLRRELAGAGFQRLKVVPRGVDTSRFSPVHRSQSLRAGWGAESDDLVVGCVGRLAPEKNLRVVLAAFERISARHPRARLVLVGEGPMTAELRAARPDAIFCGVRRDADLAAHYASMDLFLFPSMTETFGNVTTEALASGLPVVAFDHAAAGQLIRSGHNGLLAPLGDTDDFVAAAEALAGLPTLRRELGARARATALEIGWNDVVARFESHLAAACSSAMAPEPSAAEAEALQVPA